MRPSNIVIALVASALLTSCAASGVETFVVTKAPVAALVHVRVIDGTGAPAIDDQTILLKDGRITAVGPSSRVVVPSEAHALDLPGRTVMPGLVGMHDHLFYALPSLGDTSYVAAQRAFARLYLASGVTTIRTAGTIDFDGDASIKASIDEGAEPGPKIHLTSPYLEATGQNPDPDLIRQQIADWAGRGATSFKANTTLRSTELDAAVKAAHALGTRITGHLCAVGFRQAAAFGIDNLEHGLAFDTEFYSAKQPDVCPDQNAAAGELVYMGIGDAAIRETIWELVRHGVTVTSTLAVFETFAGGELALDARIPQLLSPRIRDQYLETSRTWSDRNRPVARLWAAVLRKEMEFERAFVAAGGRLIAGADPTGWGGVLAGLGDQRQLELLVEAGFSPEEAIKIATSNGATFLRESQRIGTIAAGKQADLVVVRGDPSKKISDVRKVELVFKDGVAYDPAKLFASVEGTVGQFELGSTMTRPVVLLVAFIVLVLIARLAWRFRSA